MRLLLAAVMIGIGAFFALVFHDRYWRWRDCFNELGRCYDPVSQDVYLEQSGMVWGGLAVIFLLAAVILAASWLRRRRNALAG